LSGEWHMDHVSQGFQSQYWESSGNVDISISWLNIGNSTDGKMTFRLWRNVAWGSDENHGDRDFIWDGWTGATPPRHAWEGTPAGKYYFELVYLGGDEVISCSGYRD
jgi:hypothetical protein